MRSIRYVASIKDLKVKNGNSLHVAVLKNDMDGNKSSYTMFLYPTVNSKYYATMTVSRNLGDKDDLLDPFKTDNYMIGQYEIHKSIETPYSITNTTNVNEFTITLPNNELGNMFDPKNEADIRESTFYLSGYMNLITTFITDMDMVVNYAFMNALVTIFEFTCGIKMVHGHPSQFLIDSNDIQSVFNTRNPKMDSLKKFISYNKTMSTSKRLDTHDSLDSQLSLYNTLSDNIDTNCIRDIIANNDTDIDGIVNIFINKYFEMSESSADEFSLSILDIMERISNDKVVYVSEENRNVVTLVVYLIMYRAFPNTIKLMMNNYYLFVYINKGNNDVTLISGTEMIHTNENDVDSLIKFVTRDADSEKYLELYNPTPEQVIKCVPLDKKLFGRSLYDELYSNMTFKNESVLNESMILNEAASNKSLRNAIQSKIIKYMKIVDKTGMNADKYASRYKKMSDTEFLNEMKKFVKSDKNFYMEFLPGKNYPHLEDVVEGLDYLKVPKDEYVFMPQDGNIDNPIRTRYKHPVGYVTVKRMSVASLNIVIYFEQLCELLEGLNAYHTICR